MKKKKLIPLIARTLALALMIGLYLTVLNYNERKAAEEAANEDNDEAIAVSGIAASDVAGIYYASEDVEMMLLLQNGVWIIPDDKKFPVDQTLVSNMINGIVNLSASRTVDEGELSDYGLDEPVLTIKITCTDGNVREFILGDTNSYNDSTYLLTGNVIYMINDALTGLFDSDKDSLIKISDSFPGELDSNSIVSAVITDVDGVSNEITDADGLSKVATEATKYINFKKWAGYGLTVADLAEYGISESSAKIVMEYSVATSTASTTEAKATYEVVLGTDADGTCYYTTPGSDMTYIMDKTGYDSLMSYVYYNPIISNETASE